MTQSQACRAIWPPLVVCCLAPLALVGVLAGCGPETPVVDVDGLAGAEVVVLVESETTDIEPKWAPDSGRLAFASYRDGGWGLYVVDVAGGTPSRITEPIQFVHSSWWSPDGSEIAISAGVERDDRDIFLYRVDVETGAMRKITNGPIDGAPCWSPDGRSIAFVSNRAGSFDLWVVPADGGTARQLTTDPGLEHSPRWSPDGERIAFHSDRAGNHDIYAMPAAGGDAVRLTDETATEQYPTWSPDGRWIGFHSNEGGRYNIWVVPSGGGEAVRITDSRDNLMRPAWSPDGRSLAFSMERNGLIDVGRLTSD